VRGLGAHSKSQDCQTRRGHHEYSRDSVLRSLWFSGLWNRAASPLLRPCLLRRAMDGANDIAPNDDARRPRGQYPGAAAGHAAAERPDALPVRALPPGTAVLHLSRAGSGSGRWYRAAWGAPPKIKWHCPMPRQEAPRNDAQNEAL